MGSANFTFEIARLLWLLVTVLSLICGILAVVDAFTDLLELYLLLSLLTVPLGVAGYELAQRWDDEPWKRVLPLGGPPLGVVGLVLGLTFALTEQRTASGRIETHGRLYALSLAMHDYHDKHGRLPPAVVYDKEGRPLYSWRVLLLPYLGQDDLYGRFKLDEPWDSPHNRKFLTSTPTPYRSSVDHVNNKPGTTFYQVLVGKGTAFEGREGLRLPADFPDGPRNTLLVVETTESVPWSKPADLLYEPDGPLPPIGGIFPARSGRHRRKEAVFLGVTADTRCRSYQQGMDETMLRALITRNGGENVDLGEFR